MLLFRIEDGRGRTEPLWITPGGGCNQGESFEDAAVRELWEETGIRDQPLGPCIWTRRHVFKFKGLWLDEVERFYVLHLDHAPDVSTANFEAHEVAFMPEHRWWSTDDIATSSHWFAPRGLATLLPPIVARSYPAEPVDCGV